MTISILGSAPFSESVPPSREIFTANGGVHHIERLGLRSEDVTAFFVSGNFGFDKVHLEEDLIKRHAPYRKIFLRESLRGLDCSDSNVAAYGLASNIELLSYSKMLELWTAEIHFLKLLATTLRPKNFLNSTLSFVNAMKGDRKMERLAATILSANGNKVSSGVLATMVALSIAEPEEEIHLFGITASRREYAYELTEKRLASTRKGHVSHIVPDLKILSQMIRTPDLTIVIHDKGLKEAVQNFRS